jgi:hypothetical protein
MIEPAPATVALLNAALKPTATSSPVTTVFKLAAFMFMPAPLCDVSPS